MSPRVVLLNGTGSAGKTSIALASQAIAEQPFLHVQMDMFIDMLPEHLQDHPDGFAYPTALDGGKPIVAISSGTAGKRLLEGMRHAVAAMAARGNYLIVDDVLLSMSPESGPGFGEKTCVNSRTDSVSCESVLTRHAGGDDKQAYCDLLSPFGLRRVGVFAPLDVLEDRERRRGDRLIGLARWQYERVHRGMVYDLEVDIVRSSPEDRAGLIKETFRI